MNFYEKNLIFKSKFFDFNYMDYNLERKVLLEFILYGQACQNQIFEMMTLFS